MVIFHCYVSSPEGNSFVIFWRGWSRQDITWLGGITEARRVMVMASASDVLVVPHGSFGWWKAFFLGNLALIFIRFYSSIKKTQVYQYAGISILVAIYHLVINHGSGTSTIYRSFSQWNSIFFKDFELPCLSAGGYHYLGGTPLIKFSRIGV